MGFFEERMAIRAALEYTRDVLDTLILRLDPDDQALFQEAWSLEAKSQLQEAIAMLGGEPREEDVRNRAYEKYQQRGSGHGQDFDDWEGARAEIQEGLESEQGPLRRFLTRVGMAGKSLKLKLKYLADAASEGLLPKVLDLLNKFLGSLTGGLPGVVAAKELKEWLEGFMENQPEHDPAIQNVYLRAGSDPFWVDRL